MTALLTELWELFADLWATANRWARWAILFIVLWPVVLALVAIAGLAPLTALLALLPVAAILLLMMFAITQAGRVARHVGPVGVGIAANLPGTRRAVSALAILVGMELAIGVYFTLVGVENAPEWLPLLFLAGFAILFLSIGGYRGWVRSALIALVVVLSLAFHFAPYIRGFMFAHNRAGMSFEKCVKEGGEVSECLARHAPERIKGRSSEVHELHSVGWTTFVVMGRCLIEPVTPVEAFSDVMKLKRFAPGQEFAIPYDAGKKRFWLRGGIVEIIPMEGLGCRRVAPSEVHKVS